MIVAVDRQRGIGIANQLPWHLPEDLAHFKRLTSGHAILMGRKTFESIGRPLPQRRNIVVTRNPDWQHEGVEVCTSLAAALALIADSGGYIIGGAQIFREAMPLARRLVVTEIDAVFPCDTFFPAMEPGQWQETSRQHHHSEKSGLNYDIVQYDRIA